MNSIDNQHSNHDPLPRRRRFLRFLFWNLLGSLAIAVPLYFLASPFLAISFFGLMLFMSAVVAGYFALLRVED